MSFTLQESARGIPEGTSSGSLHAIRCDLRKEDEILFMFEEIKTTHGGLDVCVNNAGLMKYGGIVNGKTEDWKEMIDVLN